MAFKRTMSLLCLGIAGCGGNSDASLSSSGSTTGARELPGGAVEVTFVSGSTDSPLAPSYSPPGKQLKLERFETASEIGVDPLVAEVVLGPEANATPIKLLLTRSEFGKPYVKLVIDQNGDGKFTEEANTIVPTVIRGKTWSNFFAVFQVNHGGEPAYVERYPANLWIAVDDEADRPDVIRMSRKGYKTSQFQLGSKNIAVVLSDANNDGVLGEDDWWEVLVEGEPRQGRDLRKVSDFAWIGDKAFQLALSDGTGRKATVTPFDPGVTREEDALNRDPMSADRRAVRAAKPLEFRYDADVAIAEAAEKKLPCFIKFETTWCGPCRMMTDLVFTAEDVVNASSGIVCVKVDGDQRKDLVKKYAVEAYPTGVMLAGGGDESGRFVGYQSVKAMSQFFQSKK